MNVFSTVLSFLKKSWRPSPSSRYWDTVISVQHLKKKKKNKKKTKEKKQLTVVKY